MNKILSPAHSLVTVITAVLNSRPFLERTILSVLEQNYKPIEYLIIDGGSTDGTVDLIKQYSDRIDFWSSEKDEGISDAFNKGVRHAKGDFIQFLGAGDFFWKKDSVAEMMTGIDAMSNILVCGNIYRVDQKNASKILWKYPLRPLACFNKKSLLFKMSVPHQALFMNKKYFEKYGFFDTTCRFSMDYELLLRSYADFPEMVMKNIVVAAWSSGGVATGRIKEVLSEQNRIRFKNKIAPVWMLLLIQFWSAFKYFCKRLLMNIGIRYRMWD